MINIASQAVKDVDHIFAMIISIIQENPSQELGVKLQNFHRQTTAPSLGSWITT